MDSTLHCISSEEGTARRYARSTSNNSTIKIFHADQRRVIQKKHILRFPEVHSTRRWAEYSLRHPQRDLRSPRRQPIPSGESFSSWILLAYRGSGHEKSRTEVRSLPEICYEASCTSHRTQHDPHRLAFCPVGTRYGRSIANLFAWKAHTPARRR